MQAQDYAAAKWLLGLRLGQASDALVERACFAELSEAERAALGAAVERFGGFLGLSARAEEG